MLQTNTLKSQEILSIDATSQFINKFYDIHFSAYDFLCLFTVLLALQKTLEFNRDQLAKYIQECKVSNQFSDLLEAINFKSNGVFPYSSELEDAYFLLKNAGILYTISPERDSTIQIFEDLPFSELIKNRLNYFNQMVAFIKSFQATLLASAPIEQEEVSNPQVSETKTTLAMKLSTNLSK